MMRIDHITVLLSIVKTEAEHHIRRNWDIGRDQSKTEKKIDKLLSKLDETWKEYSK